MKHITLIFCAMALAYSAPGQGPSAPGGDRKISPIKTASFSWANTVYDFGPIKAGIPVSYEFRFTNTGMVPLVITSVKASCGCTVAAYTKEPIERGAAGVVRASYDAAQRGRFSKTLTVTANTPEGSVILTIKGEVVEK